MFELRTFGLSSLSQDVCPCKVTKCLYENNVKYICAIGLLVIFLCNALVFDFLNTFLAISRCVVFLIKRLWCQWPSHQRVLRYVYLRLDVPRCKSCALVHHGVNFVSLPTLFWAVPV